MANKIKLKRSTVANRVPLATDLEVGEVAVNTADAKLYTKHSDGVVVALENTGPQGEQGIQGIQGDAGTNGTNGTDGADGVNGLIDNPYGALPAYSNGSKSSISWDETHSAMKLQSSSDNEIGASFPAFRVNLASGETHKLSVKLKAGSAHANGVYIRVYEYNSALPSGKTAVSNSASYAEVQEDSQGKTNWREDESVTTSWVTHEYTYTPTASAQWASIVILNWTGVGIDSLYIRDPMHQLIPTVNTDTNTWRGIKDNLTSTSTTDSLSAKQGKELKTLVDGKASSSHTHSYLGLTSKASDSDKLDGVDSSGFARFYNSAVLNSSTTTASFLSELETDYGCFGNKAVSLKVQWSYAGSSDLDTGDSIVGTIELAGCLIETWGGTYKHVRITRPTTGTGGERVCVYNDQGSGYSPSWRMIWTSDTDGSGSGLDADLLDGNHASAFATSGHTHNTATSSTAGLVKIGYTESGKNYPVELSSGKMYVNVPWSDTDTNTTYSTATSTTSGLIKIGYTESGKNYPVKLSGGKAYVNVPWSDTDTNTTYSNFTTTVSGLVPAPTVNNTAKFLRGDGMWDVPTNTTYAVGDGGLTEKNFTLTLKSKLDGLSLKDLVDVNKAGAGSNLTLSSGAGLSLTTGQDNTLVGLFTGSKITISSRNTALGRYALSSSTNYDNTAIGHESLFSATTGAGNTAIGGATLRSSTTGTRNTVVGYQANANNTISGFKVAIGAYSLYNCTTGYYNTAVGYISMYQLTTGRYNTAVGYYSLGYNKTGQYNSALGMYALQKTTGNNNTGLGYKALNGNTTGVNNSSVGYNAGYLITTGSRNTCIGSSAGDITTTGSYNITIGALADPSSATVNGECTLGDVNISNLRCNDTSISSLSDERDKTNIVDIPLGLDFINTVRPVSFDWDRRDGSMAGKKDFGFIAQELKVAQDATDYAPSMRLVHDNNPDKLEADPMKMFPIMVKAIQELTAKVEMLEAQLNK